MEKEKLEYYYKILSRVDGQLAFAESKIGFIVGYIGLLMGMLGSKAEDIQKLMSTSNTSILSAYVSGALIIAILINLLFLFKYIGNVLFPKLEISGYKSMAYFGDISKLTEKDFLNIAKSRTDNNITDDILTQIHAVSNIADHKFINIQLATKLLYPFTALWISVIAMIVIFL